MEARSDAHVWLDRKFCPLISCVTVSISLSLVRRLYRTEVQPGSNAVNARRLASHVVLRRFTRHPARIFTIVSAVALVVSFVPVVTYIPTVPGATDAQTAVLAMMHVVAAAMIVGMLRRQA